NVPDKTGEQRAEREEDGDAIRTERVAVGHGARDKWRPKAHQHTGDYTNTDAFFRDRATGNHQGAIGFAVKDDGDESADNACGKERGIAFGLEGKTGNHAHDERDSD